MGIYDRDYMRNPRSSHSHANYYPKQSRSKTSKFFRDPTNKFISIIVAAIALTIGFKYLLEYKRAVPFPRTGDVQWFVEPNSSKMARLTIEAPPISKLNYAIHLDNWGNSAPVATIYVRSGETSVTLVPLGRYRVTISKGTNWQGPGKNFGISGEVRESVEPLEFYQTGNSIVGHRIRLDHSINGNMQTQPSFRI